MAAEFQARNDCKSGLASPNDAAHLSRLENLRGYAVGEPDEVLTLQQEDFFNVQELHQCPSPLLHWNEICFGFIEKEAAGWVVPAEYLPLSELSSPIRQMHGSTGHAFILDSALGRSR